MAGKTRCGWCGNDPLYVQYHDQEWGVPVRDDRLLFESLILEGAQAGLSWITVLRKRERYREAFLGFDPLRVARLQPASIEQMMVDPGLIRNRLKLESVISNAQAFLDTQAEFGCFADYIWGFTGGQPRTNRFRSQAEVPSETELSLKISKDLRKRGFKFVGSTICYSYMQAVGMVNDHLTSCYRHAEV